MFCLALLKHVRAAKEPVHPLQSRTSCETYLYWLYDIAPLSFSASGEGGLKPECYLRRVAASGVRSKYGSARRASFLSLLLGCVGVVSLVFGGKGEGRGRRNIVLRSVEVRSTKNSFFCSRYCHCVAAASES